MRDCSSVRARCSVKGALEEGGTNKYARALHVYLHKHPVADPEQRNLLMRAAEMMYRMGYAQCSRDISDAQTLRKGEKRDA
jgi:hypothetical protein